MPAGAGWAPDPWTVGRAGGGRRPRGRRNGCRSGACGSNSSKTCRQLPIRVARPVSLFRLGRRYTASRVTPEGHRRPGPRNGSMPLLHGRSGGEAPLSGAAPTGLDDPAQGGCGTQCGHTLPDIHPPDETSQTSPRAIPGMSTHRASADGVAGLLWVAATLPRERAHRRVLPSRLAARSGPLPPRMVPASAIVRWRFPLAASGGPTSGLRRRRGWRTLRAVARLRVLAGWFWLAIASAAAAVDHSCIRGFVSRVGWGACPRRGRYAAGVRRYTITTLYSAKILYGTKTDD